MNNFGVVALVSHDAGGAELLASYAVQNKLECRLILDGPAVNVFKRRFSSLECSTLATALSDCDWFLCGTSGKSDLEWFAISEAKVAGKRVVAFLDHWMNYPQRFIRHGIQHLPDEIWVGDADAEMLAKAHFRKTPISLVPNPYFLDMQREIAALKIHERSVNARGKRVLFVSENISGHPNLRHSEKGCIPYTEFDAIEYLFDNIDALGEQIDKVVIRPHPSDPAGKYDRIVQTRSDISRLSDGRPLLEEVVESDIIVGCQSMAMVVGLLALKRVVSCVPPGGFTCSLPHKQILQLSRLVAAQKSKCQ
jgi:hypothetical protein